MQKKISKLDDLKIHHLGFAVRSIAEAVSKFNSMGMVFDHIASDLERNLSFHFGEMGGVMIELVSPYNPEKKCEVSNMTEKQPCTLYHVCYKTHNLDLIIERLKNQGFRQVGKKITSDIYGYEAEGCFLYSKETGLIELVMEHK